MYEDKTVDNIQTELLGNMDPSYEKSPGYPTYDILKAMAIEENKLYLILQTMMDMLDVDLLNGDALTKYVLQRKGIIRKLATYATGMVQITGTGTVTVGDLFSTASINFMATETIAIDISGEVKVIAVAEGITGNIGANSITMMPVTLAGIVTCNNDLATSGGYAEEADNDVRDRYYEALRLPANSGNIYHYLKWAKETTGVGEVKVVPLWNGNNTVKIVIIDSNKEPASSELVLAAQEYIDPKGIYDLGTDTWSTWGTGTGEAPMGAYCTVISATEKTINIDLVDIQEESGYALEDITISLTANIINYLKEVAFKQDFISYAKIGNVILNTEGVADYTTLTVNGGTISIAILNEEVGILGVVNVV